MSLIADVIVKLRATTAVTDQIATNPKTSTKCIRPDRLAQSDPISESAGGIEVTIDGQDYATDLSSSSKTSQVKLIIDCVSLSAALSNAIADAVEDALETWRGATAGGTVKAVDLIDRRSDWASNDDGSDSGDYVVELELSVIYTRN